MAPDLPTGKHPGWEKDLSDDDDELGSVSESCVVLQSLRQSREQWMYHIFPRFSGRARGKLDNAYNPPPHTIQSRGRCQVGVGPHVFAETSFYEVQYLPPAPAGGPFIHSWQPPYAYVPHGQPNALEATPAPVVQHTTSPLLSSLTSVTTITPALINQVNSAAASNPTLANLLQLAAAGKASPEQLQTLGLLIQSLAVPESSEALSSAANLMKSSAKPYPPPPVAANTAVKDFDLVLQYHETPSERWVLPRSPVICEKVADTRAPTWDIVLTLALQVSKISQTSAEAVDADKPPPQIVSLRLKRPPPALWETIWRWVGGEEKLKENRIILDELKKQPRVYLAHQLPQNALLSQLQNASGPQYLMKSIKPGPVIAPKPKRKPPQRKPVQPAEAVNPQSTPQASSSSVATAASSSPTFKVSPVPGSLAGTPPDPKRRKTTHIIRCVSCQQTDVPLILGFCRPCVESGKAVAVYVPSTTTPRPQQYTYQAQYVPPATPVPATPVPANGTPGSAPSVTREMMKAKQ